MYFFLLINFLLEFFVMLVLFFFCGLMFGLFIVLWVVWFFLWFIGLDLMWISVGYGGVFLFCVFVVFWLKFVSVFKVCFSFLCFVWCFLVLNWFLVFLFFIGDDVMFLLLFVCGLWEFLYKVLLLIWRWGFWWCNNDVLVIWSCWIFLLINCICYD